MHPTPLMSPASLSTLCPCNLFLPKKQKTNKQTNKHLHKSLCVSLSISVCPHIFTHSLTSLLSAMGHCLIRGLWLLVHYKYWTLTGTLLRYPVVALCHGDPAALDLQDPPLHLPQQLIDGVDVGVGGYFILIDIWPRIWVLHSVKYLKEWVYKTSVERLPIGVPSTLGQKE